MEFILIRKFGHNIQRQRKHKHIRFGRPQPSPLGEYVSSSSINKSTYLFWLHTAAAFLSNQLIKGSSSRFCVDFLFFVLYGRLT